MNDRYAEIEMKDAQFKTRMSTDKPDVFLMLHLCLKGPSYSDCVRWTRDHDGGYGERFFDIKSRDGGW